MKCCGPAAAGFGAAAMSLANLMRWTTPDGIDVPSSGR